MPDRLDDDTTTEDATGAAPAEPTAVDPTAATAPDEDAAATGAPVDGEATAGEEPAPVPAEPDPELLAAVDLARAALLEITPADTVGEPAGSTVEGDRVLSLLFHNTMAGYPGWYWTVTLARVEEAVPTVLEAALLPGDGALLSPEWLPWSDRLAGIEADEEAERVASESDDDDDDESDDDDDDTAEDAEDADDVLDGVDFEGVPAAHDDDESDDDDDDDDDDTSFDGADR
ncbi:DUF3027 domain-containing protein [Clavibacter zhangzhiyongii]|uniref:DUF3027 domain-containing protein n=1 Tax=Clavibacter zhangzhiyongii TaxID=2768071 RepID=UPI001956E720|nr:DUF3027 domain-containing protein [Clavibacter zhangzhiyongii]MBM7024651.1 DUF3027 domain-containing protein [Clavibacter zhangzhiyongii]